MDWKENTPKWKDMSLMEKILFVISCIAAVLVVASTAKPDLFPMDLTYPAIVVFTACEAVVLWNKQRKWAYLLLAGAAICLACFVLELFLMA
jgi:hypothetical protein